MSFIHRFDSDRRLFRFKQLRAAHQLPVMLCVSIVCHFLLNSIKAALLTTGFRYL